MKYLMVLWLAASLFASEKEEASSKELKFTNSVPFPDSAWNTKNRGGVVSIKNNALVTEPSFPKGETPQKGAMLNAIMKARLLSFLETKSHSKEQASRELLFQCIKDYTFFGEHALNDLAPLNGFQAVKVGDGHLITLTYSVLVGGSVIKMLLRNKETTGTEKS